MNCDRYSDGLRQVLRWTATDTLMGGDRSSLLGGAISVIGVHCKRYRYVTPISFSHTIGDESQSRGKQPSANAGLPASVTSSVPGNTLPPTRACAVQSGAVPSVIFITVDHVVNSHTQWLFTPIGGERRLRDTPLPKVQECAHTIARIPCLNGQTSYDARPEREPRCLAVL
ncbi:hypothetical protein AB205_0062810, partial [Aquarana catesbeiana]